MTEQPRNDAETVREALEFANKYRADGNDRQFQDALAALSRLVEAAEQAQREADSQMQAKLDAQVTLTAVTKALDLRFDHLGDGWRDATLVILSRIELIVDETERLARERDLAESRLRTAETALREIQEWDCLNPPRPELCADHPWLKKLVDEALEAVSA